MKNLKKQNKKSNHKPILIIFLVALVMLSLSFLTKYAGTSDIKDYADTAKLFSGDYSAKLRSSHSLIYGIIFTPFVNLTKSFIFIKLASILWLFLLMLSIYYISNKNKKTLLLLIAAPIVWYMAPWISPMPLSSLLFLWGYYFINKYESKDKVRNLFYSGLLIGLAWAFWDGAIYFTFLLAISFLYNKKLSHLFYFAISVLIGIAPKLFLDQMLFNFALFGFLRHLFAVLAFAVYGGIYGQGKVYNLVDTLILLLFIPFYSYLLLSKKIFRKHKKTIIFLLLSIIILILEPEIRFTLMLVPIIILVLGDILDNKKFRIQISILLILTLLVINPYIIQIKYQTNGEELNSFIRNLPNLQLNPVFSNDLILQDLEQIEKQYPNQTFIVGNGRDDYRTLAHLYWGSGVEEFVSIEDYNLYLNNETTIISKTLCSKSKIKERRDICMSVELRKAIDDETDYESIKYAISFEENLELENFKLIKQHQILSVHEKNP